MDRIVLFLIFAISKKIKDMTKFEKWLAEVNEIRSAEWNRDFTYRGYLPLTYTKGKNYFKIMDNTSVWGFVAIKDIPGKNEFDGDLLRPASFNAPAKHSRGNIYNGTAQWEFYGPKYLR